MSENTEAEHTKFRLERAKKSIDEALFDLQQAETKLKNAKKYLQAEEADELAALVTGAVELSAPNYKSLLNALKDEIDQVINAL